MYVCFCSVKEEMFWRNYFYRVSLVKQSAQLTALAAQQQASEPRDTEDKEVAHPEDVSLTGNFQLWIIRIFLL